MFQEDQRTKEANSFLQVSTRFQKESKTIWQSCLPLKMYHFPEVQLSQIHLLVFQYVVLAKYAPEEQLASILLFYWYFSMW